MNRFGKQIGFTDIPSLSHKATIGNLTYQIALQKKIKAYIRQTEEHTSLSHL